MQDATALTIDIWLCDIQTPKNAISDREMFQNMVNLQGR